jgi:hypothetical protein
MVVFVLLVLDGVGPFFSGCPGVVTDVPGGVCFSVCQRWKWAESMAMSGTLKVTNANDVAAVVVVRAFSEDSLELTGRGLTKLEMAPSFGHPETAVWKDCVGGPDASEFWRATMLPDVICNRSRHKLNLVRMFLLFGFDGGLCELVRSFVYGL